MTQTQPWTGRRLEVEVGPVAHGGHCVARAEGRVVFVRHGIPGEVLHIIATHSHEGDKVERSIESIIFHHADFVDFDIAKFLGKRAAKK